MSQPQFFNDPITVEALIDPQGMISPRRMEWQGRPYTVVTVGRQWSSDEGRHLLIETAGGDRFELQLSRQDLIWRLKRGWLVEAMA